MSNGRTMKFLDVADKIGLKDMPANLWPLEGMSVSLAFTFAC